VLARKETPSAYHLAVVVDDAFQGVSLVTRGNDLFASAHVQRLLQALLELPAPAYAHHRLILDEEGTRAECGLALQANNGDQITIVPGAFPYSLAVLGVFESTPHIFEPEYELDRYTRVPIT